MSIIRTLGALALLCVTTLFLTTACLAPTAATAAAQPASEGTAASAPTDLEAALAAFNGASNPQETVAAAETLIALSEGGATDWLTHYHAGYAAAHVAHTAVPVGEIDEWCDRAEWALDRAAENPASSRAEILAVQAYADYGRIRVDVMARGFSISGRAMAKLREAEQLDPDNPRIQLLLAQHYLNVPPQMGGDRAKACAYNEKAQLAFANPPASPLAPAWGSTQSNALRTDNCGGADAGAEGSDK